MISQDATLADQKKSLSRFQELNKQLIDKVKDLEKQLLDRSTVGEDLEKARGEANTLKQEVARMKQDRKK